jgi:hypothetical protein
MQIGLSIQQPTMKRFYFPPETTVPSSVPAVIFDRALSKSEMDLSKSEVSPLDARHRC